MSLIYLVRHGQTDWNREKIFRGHADRPLNDHGLREARAVADFLSGQPVNFIYASPLKRAMQTAEPLAEQRDMKVEVLPGVIDLDFGEWSGMPMKEVKDKYPDIYQDFIKHPEKAEFPGGESLREAQERAMKAVREVAERHPDMTGAIVTHRVICKIIILGLLGLDVSHFWEISQDTACINLFEYKNDRVVIRYINESCHIRNLEGHNTIDF
jgi:broad specificity phosphatase PhoE